MASELIRHIRRAVLLKELAGLSDGDLLESFVADRNQAAIEALVLRHGPMVWGVCRRILGDAHDAEDAFQATFLVLARKADSIRPRGRVAGWLHGVARQTASKARATKRKRQTREQSADRVPEPEAVPRERQDDLRLLLDEQLAGLPERYRAVIVLCDLEGRTRQEAARHLGCPEGTVAGRLARARAMLARRLARHGLDGAGGLLLPGPSSAGLPASVVSCTIETTAAAGPVSARVAALTKGVLGTMLLTRLRTVAVVLLTASVLAFATGTLIIPATPATAGSGKDDRLGRTGRDKSDLLPQVQVSITSPAGMKVQVWPVPARVGKSRSIDVPGRLDLRQGKRYRLKLAGLANRPGLRRFPTVEIPRLDAVGETFASSSAIPIRFTDTDFDQVDGGKAITKVVYLARRHDEPITIASYDCTDHDVIGVAKRRGTILAVVRMGNIELEEPGPRTDRGKAADLQRSGKPVEITIGNDGIQGRVVRTDKRQARAKERDDLAKQLADVRLHLRGTMTALASAQAKNEVLKQQLKAAELETRSLRDALARLREKLAKAKEAIDK